MQTTSKNSLSKTPYPTLDYEKEWWGRGVENVIGIDEVGKGSWAGPVVAAGVIFDPHTAEELMLGELREVRDSKLVPQKKREELSELIKKHAKAYAICEISTTSINDIGIGNCCQLAYEQVLKDINLKSVHILIDAFYIKNINQQIQTPIIKGDQKSFSIAAASIIGKVYRDQLMDKLHEKFPHFNWSKNKGYGTKMHQEMIGMHGLCEYHRTSFQLTAYTNTKEKKQIY